VRVEIVSRSDWGEDEGQRITSSSLDRWKSRSAAVQWSGSGAQTTSPLLGGSAQGTSAVRGSMTWPGRVSRSRRASHAMDLTDGRLAGVLWLREGPGEWVDG
jgi:hypothetical protein